MNETFVHNWYFCMQMHDEIGEQKSQLKIILTLVESLTRSLAEFSLTSSFFKNCSSPLRVIKCFTFLSLSLYATLNFWWLCWRRWKDVEAHAATDIKTNKFHLIISKRFVGNFQSVYGASPLIMFATLIIMALPLNTQHDLLPQSLMN